MKILLDTQVLKTWLTHDLSRLSAQTIALLQDTGTERYYSNASIWELSLKEALGASNVKLNPHEVVNALKAQGFVELPLTLSVVWGALRTPGTFGDPFDRLLLAHAKQKDLKLLTVDPLMLQRELPGVMAA